uniref:Uncharacterized protein SocA n=1 Tax=Mycobacterium tuberculosis (strain ATCC 25618 / H37Rv) TaxID=83332 RepID=SOCA_MYCTU|nr:RecName: Full=Uncharacterized protein SocA; AltName: Full=Small ORF induced by copper A; Flags: Precursor [Mycobacterium tuberculosis H37Rv]ADH04621.1 SocA [Mycobacterium tuberculosis H37Rv]
MHRRARRMPMRPRRSKRVRNRYTMGTFALHGLTHRLPSASLQTTAARHPDVTQFSMPGHYR